MRKTRTRLNRGETIPVKVSLRAPSDLMEQLKKCAEYSERSVNGEILHLLRIGMRMEARIIDEVDTLVPRSSFRQKK